MTVSVVIITYNRPLVLRRCLDCLLIQAPLPHQIIVVDASEDDLTHKLCLDYSSVTYLANPQGRGNMPSSRNKALQICSGEIIAFLDDDAFAHKGWLMNMMDTYQNPSVGGVAGRALNDIEGEAERGVDDIGKLKANGTLTGNFGADPGCIIEVDHMIGCNLSLRREVLARLGGYRDDFKTGPFGICEDSDLCVRATRLRHRLVFNPQVCADHIGAPQTGVSRFSPKYFYFHRKNNLVMLIRNFGLRPIIWRHIVAIFAAGLTSFLHRVVNAASYFRESSGRVSGLIGSFRKLAGGFLFFASEVVGLAVGFAVGIFFLLRTGTRPERKDEQGRQISRALSSPPSVCEPPIVANE